MLRTIIDVLSILDRIGRAARVATPCDSHKCLIAVLCDDTRTREIDNWPNASLALAVEYGGDPTDYEETAAGLISGFDGDAGPELDRYVWPVMTDEYWHGWYVGHGARRVRDEARR